MTDTPRPSPFLIAVAAESAVALVILAAIAWNVAAIAERLS